MPVPATYSGEYSVSIRIWSYADGFFPAVLVKQANYAKEITMSQLDSL
jgi:hypothetical protein